jgi:hypothetical protein
VVTAEDDQLDRAEDGLGGAAACHRGHVRRLGSRAAAVGDADVRHPRVASSQPGRPQDVGDGFPQFVADCGQPVGRREFEQDRLGRDQGRAERHPLRGEALQPPGAGGQDRGHILVADLVGEPDALRRQVQPPGRDRVKARQRREPRLVAGGQVVDLLVAAEREIPGVLAPSGPPARTPPPVIGHVVIGQPGRLLPGRQRIQDYRYHTPAAGQAGPPSCWGWRPSRCIC